MVRPFSTDPLLNPDGWIGDNWQGRGYDIYSFFPEFTNFPSDPIGMGDFTVDYQDTSDDWWRITEEVKPVAIITFSRTSQYPRQWEVERRQRNLATWVDDYVAPLQPTPAPPDASVPAGFIRESTLPMENIVNAVRARNECPCPALTTPLAAGFFRSSSPITARGIRIYTPTQMTRFETWRLGTSTSAARSRSQTRRPHLM